MKNLFLIVVMLVVAVGSLATNTAEGVAMAMSIPAVDSRGLFTKSLLTAYKERVQPTMFLKSFFPTSIKMTKQVSVEVQRGTEKVAVDVIRGTNGNRNTFSNSTERLYIPPMYHEYFTVSELEVYDRAMAQESPSAFVNMVNKVADYMAEQRYKIERAIELQCAQSLQTGIILLKNGDNIDYKRKAGSMVNVSAGSGEYWTHANGDPLKDLENGAKFLRETGKYTGAVINCVIGSKALDALKNNEKFQKIADLRRFELAEVALGQRNSEGAAPAGRATAGSWDIRFWTYPGYYEDTNGNMTPFIDPENFIMLPEVNVGETAFAMVPQIFSDQGQRPQSGEYLIQDFIDEKAATHESHIKSCPLSIPVKVDMIYTGQAVSKS